MKTLGYDQNQQRLLRAVSTASVAVAIVLIVVKTYAYAETGSVSLLSSLADSFLDAVASILNLIAVRIALTPADQDHRFGHGKAEALAGLGQACLIGCSVIFLVVESVKKLLNPEPISSSEIGISIMLFSIVLTLLLVLFQNWTFKKTGSLAIKADASHYRMDLLVNLAVIVAIAGDYFFSFALLDPIIALLIAAYISLETSKIFIQSLDQLMDKELSEDDRRTIHALAIAHPQVEEVHDLRTRCSGSWTFIQFHMELDPNMRLIDAHRISDDVADVIIQHFPGSEVFIHQDPKGLDEEHTELERTIVSS